MGNDYDYVILGAGIYGMFAAKLVAEQCLSALIIECDDRPFSRASYINQARVHNGYHYPRSYSTATKSSKYYNRFVEDFSFAINKDFKKIYAISSKYSLTSSRQFKNFCLHAKIPCDQVDPDKYFNHTMVEAAFETQEYCFDAMMIRDDLLGTLKSLGVMILFNEKVVLAKKTPGYYDITLSDGRHIKARNVINCTYASVNQVNRLFGFEPFKIKYEIAEVILCNVSENLDNVGLTVMDGPFFSIMPFGKTGYHTLTSVTFTPHKTCHESLPSFDCQAINGKCSTESLQNCNSCPARPTTAMPYMHQLAKKYLVKDTQITYRDSVFAIKPILLASEIDDSRPTLIRKLSAEPGFTAVLSGKINTIYDMESMVL